MLAGGDPDGGSGIDQLSDVGSLSYPLDNGLNVAGLVDILAQHMVMLVVSVLRLGSSDSDEAGEGDGRVLHGCEGGWSGFA